MDGDKELDEATPTEEAFEVLEELDITTSLYERPELLSMSSCTPPAFDLDEDDHAFAMDVEKNVLELQEKEHHGKPRPARRRKHTQQRKRISLDDRPVVSHVPPETRVHDESYAFRHCLLPDMSSVLFHAAVCLLDGPGRVSEATEEWALGDLRTVEGLGKALRSPSSPLSVVARVPVLRPHDTYQLLPAGGVFLGILVTKTTKKLHACVVDTRGGREVLIDAFKPYPVKYVSETLADVGNWSRIYRLEKKKEMKKRKKKKGGGKKRRREFEDSDLHIVKKSR